MIIYMQCVMCVNFKFLSCKTTEIWTKKIEVRVMAASILVPYAMHGTTDTTEHVQEKMLYVKTGKLNFLHHLCLPKTTASSSNC